MVVVKSSLPPTIFLRYKPNESEIATSKKCAFKNTSLVFIFVKMVNAGCSDNVRYCRLNFVYW